MTKPITHYRHARERCFIIASMVCIAIALVFLITLVSSVVFKGWRGFFNSSVKLEIMLEPAAIGTQGDKTALAYQRLIKKTLLNQFPVSLRNEKKYVRNIVSARAGKLLRDIVLQEPDKIGQRISVWLPAGAIADSYFRGSAEALRQQGIPENHLQRLQQLYDKGQVRTHFNSGFFTGTDSRNSEVAGIGGALRGSFYTLLLTFVVSFPTGTMAAVYLELFAPRGRWWQRWLDIVEININNLAAVPSVIFGLLGLAIFINVFHLPRSSPLVGGLVLSLMTFPTIIIAARASLRSVPATLLTTALSLGATRMQGVFQHVLPAALPGILTGTIIGMAQALGETAPLLMIGMVSFIADAPSSLTDAATTLPVQIFLWADSPERGFAERTSMAIIVLLGFLVIMNATAIFLRQKLEIKW